MKRLWGLVCVLTFVGVAQAITIADINAGNLSGCGVGCYQIGDKEFRGLSVVTATAGFDNSSVTVSPGQNNTPSFVEITFGGAFAVTGGVDNGKIADFQLFYNVTSLGGAIAAIDQKFNLTNLGAGGTVAIGESVYSSAIGGLVARSNVGFSFGVDDPEDPPGEELTGDQLIIATPLQRVWVTKDVYLQANALGTVGATILTQSYHQVPEPAHAAFLLFGCLMVWLHIKSRKSVSV